MPHYITPAAITIFLSGLSLIPRYKLFNVKTYSLNGVYVKAQTHVFLNYDCLITCDGGLNVNFLIPLAMNLREGLEIRTLFACKSEEDMSPRVLNVSAERDTLLHFFTWVQLRLVLISLTSSFRYNFLFTNYQRVLLILVVNPV